MIHLSICGDFRSVSSVSSISDCSSSLNAAANTSGLPTPPSGLRPPSGHFGRPKPSRPSSVVSTASSDHNGTSSNSSRRNSRLLQISTPPLLPEATASAPPPPLPPKESEVEQSPSSFPPRPPKDAPPLPPKAEQLERTPSPPPRPETRRAEDLSPNCHIRVSERNVELLLSEEPPPASLNDISPVEDTCEEVECPSADDSGISYEEHTSSPKQSPDLLQQRLSDSSSLGSSSRESHISQEDNQPTVLETTVSEAAKIIEAEEIQTVQLTNVCTLNEKAEEVNGEREQEVEIEEDEYEEDDLLHSHEGDLQHSQNSHFSSLSDTVLIVDPLLIKIPEPPQLEVREVCPYI